MNKKKKTSWKAVCDGAATRVYEIIGEEGKTYEEAKTEALLHLESAIRPYVVRLETLRRNEFLERGRIPDLKVWDSSRYSGCPALRVAAKTKKRAIELVNCTCYEFQRDYELVSDDTDWWYGFARDEGVWVWDSSKRWLRCLSQVERAALLEEAVHEYEHMPFSSVAALDGQTKVSHGTTSGGVSYKITGEIGQRYGRCIYVSLELDDYADTHICPRCRYFILQPDDQEVSVASGSEEPNLEVTCASSAS